METNPNRDDSDDYMSALGFTGAGSFPSEMHRESLPILLSDHSEGGASGFFKHWSDTAKQIAEQVNRVKLTRAAVIAGSAGALIAAEVMRRKLSSRATENTELDSTE